MRHAVPILFVFLAGCTSFAPFLTPISKPPTASTSEAVHVIVKPITTKGIGSDDEKQWGIEISEYFTAFEIALLNNTKQEVLFNPLRSYLLVEDEQKLPVLNEAAAIQYYKKGDESSRFIFIPKSREKIMAEINRIKGAMLPGGSIQPKQQQKGLIFFKKVKQDHCENVVLNLEGITLVKTGKEKRFSFVFSCVTKG